MEETVWQLMVDSFTYEERRSRADQEAVMRHPDYRMQVFRESGQVIGLIGYWLLKAGVFIEHFAVAPSHRNKGLGARFLKEACLQPYGDKTIILEVERPETDLARRRIGFYERAGFGLNPYNYMQPSYHEDGHQVPLFLMSYPQSLNYENFKSFRKELYEKVYNLETV